MKQLRPYLSDAAASVGIFPALSFRMNLDTHMPLRWCALASAYLP